VGGVHIITVFADGGYRLLPFDMRRLNVQAQHPEGVTMET
jgi:hypothetical protein